MSTLKELLNKHCPDGVEWKKLGEVCNVQSGGTPLKTKVEYWENGNIKWLGSGVCKNKKTVDEITDYISELGLTKSSAKLMKENTTLIALVGTTIGKVAFLPFEAAINQNIAGIYPIDTKILNPSFVYYICTTYYKDFISLGNGKLTMANLSFVRNLKIPVPPIEVQKEIVRILDTFTKYQDLLNRELELRKKQYEYYRDKLLTFGDEVEYIPVGSLMERVREKGKDDLNVKQVYVVSNTKGIVRSEDYHDNSIHSDDTSNYTILRQDMFAYNPSRLNIGSIGRLKTSISGLVSPMYVVFSVDKSVVDVKYFEYFIKSPKIINKIDSLKEEGARFRFDYNRWNWIDIPVPPLEEQERIVNILDKFDALCNDITKGLPAEIELRKKQYEYYRDKLLTFKEKKK